MPKFLKFVKNFQYYSLLFIRVLKKQPQAEQRAFRMGFASVSARRVRAVQLQLKRRRASILKLLGQPCSGRPFALEPRKILAKFCKFLAGSFSAVSKRNFARKYAFDSIFQALQDLHPFAPLQSQNFRKKSV